MSTRSYIGVVRDGEIYGIYCHGDGHVNYVGKILIENYDSRLLAEELIGLGDISSLGLNVESTKAYHRDRGEKWHQICSPNTNQFIITAMTKDAEYIYLYKDCKWHYVVPPDVVFHSLNHEVIKQFEEK